MALIKCTECGSGVSSTARTCPRCGAPLAKIRRKRRANGCLVGCLAIILAPIVIGAIGSTIQRSRETPQEHAAREAREEREAKDYREKAKAVDEKSAEKGRERQAQIEKFKKWAFENTAATHIEFEGGPTIFVRLKPEKYTSPENVRQIAETLARWYAHHAELDFAVCHVFLGNKEYAKGEYSK